MGSTKTCPDCAEGVASAADVCRYCGHAFEGGRAWRAKRRREAWLILAVVVALLVGLYVAVGQASENEQRKACEGVERGLGVDRDC